MEIEVGDIVGWRFSLCNDLEEDAEHHGEVIAIHADFIAIRSHSITIPTRNPFHSRHVSMCHLVRKKAA